jgi:hypothetical protein
MPMSNEEIAAEMDRQVRVLFPSAKGLTNTWHSIVKIGQSLYRCAPLQYHCLDGVGGLDADNAGAGNITFLCSLRRKCIACART